MKRLAIIGVAIFTLGLVLSGAAFMGTGGNLSKLSTVEAVEKREFSTAALPKSIEVEDKNTRVQLGRSPDEKLHLIYYENSRLRYEIQEGESLVIRKVSEENWSDHVFRIDLRNYELRVLLPRDFAGDLTLKTSNASILADDLSLTGDLSLETSNASISLGDIWARDIVLRSSNASIKAEELKAQQGISVRSSNASLRFDQLDAGESISLETSNNSISAEVGGPASDFSIRSATSNSSNSLPTAHDGGAKQLEVRTSNGKIYIDFDGFEGREGFGAARHDDDEDFDDRNDD